MEFLKAWFSSNGFMPHGYVQQPKLILLDLKLPKVDGIEVLRQAKSDHRTKVIPTIVLTSSKEEKDLVQSYQLGVNSYIQKPVDFGQFRETVKQLGLYWLLVNQAPRANAFQTGIRGQSR